GGGVVHPLMRRYAYGDNFVLYIPKKNGNKNPKCFLKGRGGCSDIITREHYISHKLLNIINQDGKSVDITGLHWIPKDKLKGIGKANLVSNILCKEHNSNLSPLDSHVGRFVEAIHRIDKGLLANDKGSLCFEFDGRAIEQWLIKTLVGLVESKNIKARDGTDYIYSDKCIKLLCEPRVKWPKGWGLYVQVPDGHIHHANSFELIPMYSETDLCIRGIKVKFNGFSMVLVIGFPSDPSKLGLYRPMELQFKKDSITHKIKLNWPSIERVKPQFITFTQVGSYQGIHPAQNMERI
ncbi:hypothetical protein O5P97_004888, partial [Vibrio parahaemolyticus]|nr:hypothetical protein [Vibrio parahaemolyticus]